MTYRDLVVTGHGQMTAAEFFSGEVAVGGGRWRDRVVEAYR